MFFKMTNVIDKTLTRLSEKRSKNREINQFCIERGLYCRFFRILKGNKIL